MRSDVCAVSCLLAALLIGPGTLLLSVRSAQAEVDFRDDIEPVLSYHCYECHGPKSREGGLRLTNREDAFRPGDYGIPVITEGHSDMSPLIDLLVDEDPDERMPKDAEALSSREIDLLRRWIDEGATWPASADAAAGHWAYQAVERPQLPQNAEGDWGLGPIDRFIFRRMNEAGYAPTRRAPPEALVWRLHFDLIGLPPAPEVVARFVADPSEAAYRELTELLLASPRFGEHWAVKWLDLARYSDSTGFMNEQMLPSWPYRDWVVGAVNHDLPFDEFTVHQLAGDLLPSPTAAQACSGIKRVLGLWSGRGATSKRSFLAPGSRHRRRGRLESGPAFGSKWLTEVVVCM